jgi:hypothetical protein
MPADSKPAPSERRKTMTDKKREDVFTEEEITAIKQYIEKCFPDYLREVHHE